MLRDLFTLERSLGSQILGNRRSLLSDLRFVLLPALLMYSLALSANGPPDPDFVDAAWVSQRTKLTKIAASDGSVLLEVASGSC